MAKGLDPGERMILTATVRQEMPAQILEVMRKQNLRIKLDKVVAARLFDQQPGMVASDGCISAPSGPSC
jgi:hypothetical protein